MDRNLNVGPNEPSDDTESSQFPRLSVNMNEETAEQLRTLKRLQDISTTEVIRRAIALSAFVTEQIYCTVCMHGKGCDHVRRRIEIVDPDNGTTQQLIQLI